MWTIPMQQHCPKRAGAILLAKKITDQNRRILLIAPLIGAGISVLTTVLMRTLPPDFLNSLYSGTVASLFGLDGESAEIAADYEVWCKVWFALVLATCVSAWIFRYAARGKAP